MKKSKILNILIIIIGTIFILLGAFHNNIWFDESYSIGIVNHSFSEIWTIGANDVHPILYYWILKVISLIFGNSILVYRIFSCFGIVTLGILGYTHIRKDFGEKTGIIFSLFSFFLPVMSLYAPEIRMYSWAITFITLTSIYAYRIIKTGEIKNWIIFAIFSLASAYTHYYGLMATGIINGLLLIYLIIKKKEQKGQIKKFVISAIVQIALYIPWIIYFLNQLKHVSSGFWIGIKFPDTLIETFQFQFLGNLPSKIAIISGVLIFTYIIWVGIKEKGKNILEGTVAFVIYLLVIIAALIISIIKMPILYPRYLFVTTGLLIFTFAFFMSKEKNKYITIMICLIVVGLGTLSNIKNIKTNYDKSNMKQIEYVKQNIGKEDIIIYTQISGINFAVNIEDNKQYFYNKDNWGVEEAYKAYSPQMQIVNTLDFLENYKGRIWIIDEANSELYNIFPKQYITKELEKKSFETAYKNLTYNITLIEK